MYNKIRPLSEKLLKILNVGKYTWIIQQQFCSTFTLNMYFGHLIS